MITDILLFLYFFFFFQAEDGIRDPLVTGVQTCALPIYFPNLTKRGWRHRQPLPLRFRSRSLQRAPGPAEAAMARAGVPAACVPKACVPTFTLICLGFASSRFGRLSVSTPF